MKKIIKNKKYEGQALAITMIVLVVSALIGLSIYSRAMKDQVLTMEERASAEALEISDAILEKLTMQPISEVVEEMEKIMDEFADVDEGIVFTENKEQENDRITELFRRLGLIDQTSSMTSLLSPVCPIGEDEAGINEYELTVKTADENTFMEYRAGLVWSLPAGNLLQGREDCGPLQLRFRPAGDDSVGFVIMKVYCEYDGNNNVTSCKEYEVERGFDKHCFAAEGQVVCNNNNFTPSDHWETYQAEEVLDINLSGANVPTEIRVVPVGGTIALSYSFENKSCLEGLRMYQLRATANCFGVYRGKEILLPEREWHDPIFDYVIFNNEGPI